MHYRQYLHKHYPKSTSKIESLHILQKYKNKLSLKEYEAIYHTLCNQALEGIYLNEKDIAITIAHLRREITLDEIVEIAKAS